MKAIRLTVRKTYGARQAFVNEIRVSAGGRAAWMRGGVGIMVHWLFPSYRDVDRWTDKFDVDAFLHDFRETGADWLVFTAGQCRGAYASPNEAFVRQCGEGHTPRRDLLLEIARGVKAMGKRFIVYSAVDFVRDGCDDHSMQRGLCWDNKGVDRLEFERRWSAVLGEWSLRLGNLCDGWWLDGCSEVQYPQGVTWPLWLDCCRAGNPLAAVAFNGGANRFAGKWGPSDYTAGETASLVSAEEVVGKVGDEFGCQRHYLFPVDGYWGGFWPWPKGEWARTEELQRTRPEMFDRKRLDEMLERREFPRPIYTPERLKRFLAKARQAGSAVTINVGISPEGRLNPLSMELISSARR